MEDYKFIYVVSSYGGEYECSWENIECAFRTRTIANNWIKNRKKLAESIGKDKFKEIEGFIHKKEDEIYRRYYNEDTDELLEGKSDKDYLSENNRFHDIEKFALIKDEFGIEKNTYDILCQIFDNDFCDYSVKKTKLYN